MSLQMLRRHRFAGAAALLAALALGIAGGMFDIVPVTSQGLSLEAQRAPGDVDTTNPWDAIWNGAPRQDVPLTPQNVTPPFGGGTVKMVTARALHDGERIYVLLEWADPEANDTVNGYDEWGDAAAVMFPSEPGTQPVYTMGNRDGGVNIWQWKAVWQADIERGFVSGTDLYPNTVADLYPNTGDWSLSTDDSLWRPAEYVGNPLAQRHHDTPVENLVALGYGTLTTSDVQNVDGTGAWQGGKWRALFVRDFAATGDGLAQFAVGDTTSIAFAVWDGGVGERDGIKSVANWIDLTIGTQTAPIVEDGGDDKTDLAMWSLVIVLVVGVLAAVGASAYVLRRGSSGTAGAI